MKPACASNINSVFCWAVAPPAHLEDEAVAELRVGAGASGLGLPRAPVVGQEPDLHQSHVAVEMRGEVGKAEQRDGELLAGGAILH